MRSDLISIPGSATIAPFQSENKGIGCADAPSEGNNLQLMSPTDFPKGAEPAIFDRRGLENAALGVDLTRKVPGPKPKAEILRR
jgi:hypothetical protein